MKKKNIINLIRYHAENNEPGFRSEAYEIAKEFEQDSTACEKMIAGRIYYGTIIKCKYLRPTNERSFIWIF